MYREDVHSPKLSQNQEPGETNVQCQFVRHFSCYEVVFQITELMSLNIEENSVVYLS